MPKVDHRAKLAELKALRQAGKKAFESYQVEDADNLYDEVDEAGYKKIVRERLNQDDFVVDDNGEGYADDGREDWDRVRQYESDSEGEGLPARGRPSKACECGDDVKVYIPRIASTVLTSRHSKKESPR
jgi:DNA polymerase alpha subunit A